MQINQDLKQRIKIGFKFVLYSYKLLMACMLSIFVPQRCSNGEACSLNSSLGNLVDTDDSYKKATITINIITFLMYAFTFIIQVKRENTMIKYLDIDKDKPDNNLPNIIDDYPLIKEKITKANQLYFKSYCALLCVILINIFTSMKLLFIDNYLDSTTTTVFLTNMILISDRLYDCFSVIILQKKKGIVQSVYLREYKSFNVIDPEMINKV